MTKRMTIRNRRRIRYHQTLTETGESEKHFFSEKCYKKVQEVNVSEDFLTAKEIVKHS